MDVSFLSPVLDASGPFATVCADVTHITANAVSEVEFRVRAAAVLRYTDASTPSGD
jgi:hypothetical protein